MHPAVKEDKAAVGSLYLAGAITRRPDWAKKPKGFPCEQVLQKAAVF